MRLDFCVACGCEEADRLENHHLKPRSEGGTDEDFNLITLCHSCHGVMHNYKRADIRELTKRGLQRAKLRGVRLGSPNGFNHLDEEAKKNARLMAITKSKENAVKFAEDMRPILEAIQADGYTSFRSMSMVLNEKGIPTRRGGKWTATSIKRVLQKLQDDTEELTAQELEELESIL